MRDSSPSCAAAADERHAPLLDPVAEPGEQGGQHGQRADIATATTMIVPTANEMNVLSPVRNMPAIATITVMPEIEHRAAGRRGGGRERRARSRPAARSSRSRSQVEERVVDADREADQQDHLADEVASIGTTLAREGDEAERGEDGGEREQQRHAGGDERAEDEDEDDERDRERELARPS